MKKILAALLLPILFSGCASTLDSQALVAISARLERIENKIGSQEKDLLAPEKPLTAAEKWSRLRDKGLTQKEKDFILLLFNDLQK